MGIDKIPNSSQGDPIKGPKFSNEDNAGEAQKLNKSKKTSIDGTLSSIRPTDNVTTSQDSLTIPSHMAKDKSKSISDLASVINNLTNSGDPAKIAKAKELTPLLGILLNSEG